MINDTYFTKFNSVPYANNTVTNISERVAILHSKLINPDSSYNVSLPGDGSVRPDIVANSLYNDPFRDWMLWLTNKTIDPYYCWYMDGDQFAAHIIDVYGSEPFAQNHIEYWRTSWPLDKFESRIPVAFYENDMPSSWQKYFQPVYDDNTNAILYYCRGYYDWRVSSNEMVSYSYSGGNTFMTGNVVQFTTAGNNVVGSAQVVESNSSVLIVQHTSNNVVQTPLGVVDMFNANVAGTVSNANVIVQLISPSEIVFWEPVSSYTVEEEANAYRRFVSIIAPSSAMSVSTVIGQLLKAS